MDDMNWSAFLPAEDESQDDASKVTSTSHFTLSFERHPQVFQYALHHHLTKVPLSDILNLIDNSLPTTNSMVSLYKLKKNFLLYQDITYTNHFCCLSCHAALSSLESPCPNNCDTEAIDFLSPLNSS